MFSALHHIYLIFVPFNYSIFQSFSFVLILFLLELNKVEDTIEDIHINDIMTVIMCSMINKEKWKEKNDNQDEDQMEYEKKVEFGTI